MNDDRLSELDARATAAAADLRQRATDRPRPPFDADLVALVGRRRRSARPALAVAAVLVLVLGALAWWAGHRGSDQDPADVVTTDPRPFVLGHVPKGLAMVGAAEVTADPVVARGGSLPGPLAAYGPAPDDLRLGVAVFTSFDEDTAERGGTDLEIDGHQVFQFDGMGLGRRTAVAEVRGHPILAVSPSLSRAELVDVLRSVTVDGDVATVPAGALPGGWSHQESAPDPFSVSSPAALSAGPVPRGSYVVYQRGGSSTSSGDKSSGTGTTTTTSSPPEGEAGVAMVTVASSAGDEGQLALARLTADESEVVAVRGHRAVLTRSAVGSGAIGLSRSLVWLEAPGEVLRVGAIGLSDAELRDLAEHVQPVSASTWQDIQDRTQLGELDPANADAGPVTRVADGHFADGTRWLVGVVAADGTEGAGPSLRFSVADVASLDSSSTSFSTTADGSGPPPAIISQEIQAGGAHRYLAALVSEQVASAELRAADGTVVDRPEIASGGGYRVVVLVATPDAPGGGRDLVLLDAEGKELTRVDLVAESPGARGHGESSGSPTTVVGRAGN